jgi:ATP-binding cassette subfamily B multidrug efflux pump
VRDFFEPISMLAQRYTILQSSLAGAERIFRLLETKEPDATLVENTSNGDPSLAVELSHVSFEYKPGVPVLQDVSLSARPGEKIALVGPTGSGKSTIASLLLRLYDVENGHVRVMGRDVRGVPRTELRSYFSVVPQDVFLFPGTIADNVAAGETPDLARVEAVLRRIDAFTLFEKRGGLLATVEERGGNFSVGERQLLAFARALYRDAPILVLDEATASVDSDTESRLQRAVDELMKERTALIIAHRLSTIRAADRIAVMQNGAVVEQGSHQELVAKDGLYRRLHQLHFARQG